MYDFIVIGAGIAGITIAESLQRAGKHVLLLESKEYVCAEASSQQAGWFHTGALYAALPDTSFMATFVKNLGIINQYYRDFENMNLFSNGDVYLANNNGWFSNNIVYYYYVSSRSQEVPILKKLPWWFITQSVRSRWRIYMRYIDDESPSVHIGQYSVVLSSLDRTMEARLIAIDLLRSFLGSGGELRTNTPVIHVNKGQVSTSSETIRCQHVIVATGKAVNELTNLGVRFVASPLAVAYPSLTTHNFVKMTPTLSQTFNHLYHSSGGKEYSVIGNASYYPKVTDDLDTRIRELFSEMIRSFFPDSNSILNIYYGYKTEIVHKGQLRNYQSHLINTRDCLVAIPGKFSLSFSLAMSVCQYYNIKPVTGIQRLASFDEVEKIVSLPQHYLQATRLM